jgi:hypothetical protein
MVKNRYLFAKRLYPNYLIIFVDSSYKFKSMGIDKELLRYIQFTNLENYKVNHVIIDKRNNVIVKNYYKKNNYYLYFYRYAVTKLLVSIYDKKLLQKLCRNGKI